MEIVFSNHAKIRLRQKRQKHLRRETIVEKAKSIPGIFFTPTKMRFDTKFDNFDLVIHDKKDTRIIITIIGNC